MGVVGRAWGGCGRFSGLDRDIEGPYPLACHSRCQWASKPIADMDVPLLVWGCLVEKRTSSDSMAAREGGYLETSALRMLLSQ